MKSLLEKGKKLAQEGLGKAQELSSDITEKAGEIKDSLKDKDFYIGQEFATIDEVADGANSLHEEFDDVEIEAMTKSLDGNGYAVIFKVTK